MKKIVLHLSFGGWLGIFSCLQANAAMAPIVPQASALSVLADTAMKADAQNEAVFSLWDEYPVFPEGDVAKWVMKHIKVPKKPVPGKFFTRFMINKEGKVKNIEILRSPNKHYNRRVIRQMPDWKPSKRGGEPIDIYLRSVVSFPEK